MSKNICFITPSIYPDVVGGAEVFNYYLIKELAKKNNISYVSSSKKTIANTKKHQLKTKRDIYKHFEIFLKILKSSKNRVFVVSFMKTKWYYIIMYPLLKVFFNKKYVIIIHGGGMMPWKWKYPFILFFKKAKTIFGVSNIICEEYYKRTNINIKYLPPIIPFKLSIKEKTSLREEYKIDKEAKVFLIVGSLKTIKKPLIVLEALNIIDEMFLKNQKVCVLFAGEGPLKIVMEKFTKDNELTNIVHLLGNIPRELIDDYYKLSDYYIISSDFEGTPISMLEAMYNKLSIIGSDAKGINNIINDSDGGFLFDNTNALELSKLMIDLISKEHKEKRENAYNYFNEKFNYQKLVNEFLSNI